VRSSRFTRKPGPTPWTSSPVTQLVGILESKARAIMPRATASSAAIPGSLGSPTKRIGPERQPGPGQVQLPVDEHVPTAPGVAAPDHNLKFFWPTVLVYCHCTRRWRHPTCPANRSDRATPAALSVTPRY
jgi:hypothetical protein